MTTYLPEPFASMVDILQAAKEVENAIHATNAANTIDYLTAANTWLGYAKVYFETAISSGHTKYQDLLKLVEAAMSDISELKAGVSTAADLASYQAETIYSYQAYLGYLYVKVNKMVMMAY